MTPMRLFLIGPSLLGAALALAPTAFAADAAANVPEHAAESKSTLPPAIAELTAAATRLTDPANDPAWRDLIAALKPNKTRQSAFEERRYFPFRKTRSYYG